MSAFYQIPASSYLGSLISIISAVDSSLNANELFASKTSGTQWQDSAPKDRGISEIALDVLNVIERYGRHINQTAAEELAVVSPSQPAPEAWIGKHSFLPQVEHWVRQWQPVELTMPAFPFKSSNRVNKVLGHLPDYGEELALVRLHTMAMEVAKVYPPGAHINLAMDGVVFNDIVGITDEDCWDYSEGLKAIIRQKNLWTLRPRSPQAILSMISPDTTSKAAYLSTIDQCRTELDSTYGLSEDAIKKRIANDKDTNMTYCGMQKFLESELETHPDVKGNTLNQRKKITKAKAKRVMQRSEAFTLALRTLFPNHIRLSMHPSSGAVKLSIPLIPNQSGDFQKSPWHSCVAVDADGSLRCVHSGDVKDTHDLVYHDGRPWMYRAKRAIVADHTAGSQSLSLWLGEYMLEVWHSLFANGHLIAFSTNM